MHDAPVVPQIEAARSGNLQYTQDYDEKYPLRRFAPFGTGAAYSSSDPAERDYDDNSWRTVVQPYIKSTQLFACPSNPDNSKKSYDPEFNRSYAANATWIVNNGVTTELGCLRPGRTGRAFASAKSSRR
jgi:hypothetical protein